MLLTDYFETIYCFNLKRRPDRKERMLARFERLGIKDKVIFVESIPVENYSFLHIEPERLKYGWENDNLKLLINIQHLHINMIERFKKSKNYLVFEDDVLFKDDFEKSFDSIKQLKEWDILYLGGFFTGFEPNYYENGFVRCFNYTGGFSYAVNSSCYEDFAQLLSKELDWTDKSLMKLQQTKKCYTFSPRICSVELDNSDLNPNSKGVTMEKHLEYVSQKDFNTDLLIYNYA